MKEFKNSIHMSNKSNFQDIYYSRVLCYLRKNVFEHILREKENDYFDLEKFGYLYFKNQNNREELVKKLSITIMDELQELEWKCKLSFGGTALFIYSTDDKPVSCWDDGL
jgi:hypothetical protein